MVDRVLLTRIKSPAFEDCDTFVQPIDETTGWHKSSYEELASYVGFEPPLGDQEEKGTVYEFQLWQKQTASENTVYRHPKV